MFDMNRVREYFNTPVEELIQKADAVCRENLGNLVWLRGLIEFSNYCSMDCNYCGIRHSNCNVHRYRIEEEGIIDIVLKGWQAGLSTFVLQSGEDSYYTIPKLCSMISSIKDKTEGKAAVTLSCGIRSRQQFSELKKAGCDRYLMRFETADES